MRGTAVGRALAADGAFAVVPCTTTVTVRLSALLLAPVIISIHRFMVLEEVTRTYVRPAGEPALQAYALGCTRARLVAAGGNGQCGPQFGGANPPADPAVIAVTATDKSE